MLLVRIGRDGDALRRHRQLRGRNIAQVEEPGQEMAVTGREADPQAGQVRALGQRLEYHYVGEVLPRGLEHAGGRLARVDFGVALVAEDQKAEAAGECREAAEIIPARDRALRVRG